MQIKFNSSLEYQRDAINSVVDLLEGQEKLNSFFEIATDYRLNHNQQNLFPNEEIIAVGNKLNISNDDIFNNLKEIQRRNNIDDISSKNELSFSVEMETGTGKTYVFLRTIFELNKKYGFLKFIIIVPSIAIREGLKSSLRMMSSHFKDIYNNAPFSYFVYDSSRLNEIKDFATNNKIQIMIINIQSFQRDENNDSSKGYNIINRENDRTGGFKPIEFIQKTNPIVIIDEPQSVSSTGNAKKAIERLNPLLTVSYSATHRELKNLLYRLSPSDAYDKGLVKTIVISSIKDENYNHAYLRLLKLDNSKGKIRALVEIHKKYSDGKIDNEKLWIKQGDDLLVKSKGHHVYKNNYIVSAIDCTTDREYVQFTNGITIKLKEISNSDEGIMNAQIRATIKEHLLKEKEFKEKKINAKVLSLFFINKVEDYRKYEKDGINTLGKIGKSFEEIYKDEYEELLKDNPNSLIHLKNFKIEELHGGYFSKDKENKLKNTDGNTKSDESTYELIMRDKEKLLNPLNPLRFIFSHSALREGWDNPNVFQVCVLRDVKSDMARRQQIGRGLRLAVNADGDRIDESSKNSSINILTVIASESYEDFVSSLQGEFEKDGIKFKKEQIKNKSNEKTLKLNKEVFNKDGFKKFWKKISRRTKYKISFDTNELIEKASCELKNRSNNILESSYSVEKHEITSIKDGIKGNQTFNSSVKDTRKSPLPDLVTYIQEQTDISRSSICEILKKSDSYESFKKNPQSFMKNAIEVINKTIQQLIFSDNKNGIKYEHIDLSWDDELIKNNDNEIIYFDTNDNDNIHTYYEISDNNKSLFNFIKCDSKIEYKYAEDLHNNQEVELFLKLPNWFVINTPLGSYNPDWGFVFRKEDKNISIYATRETKGTTDKNELRPNESNKVMCGKKHFEALGVDFGLTKELKECITNLKNK
jgi:type III restriction enzyme